ncbi:MAG: ATP-dependent Clp protease ATP-binding subunit [bacterium]
MSSDISQYLSEDVFDLIQIAFNNTYAKGGNYVSEWHFIEEMIKYPQINSILLSQNINIDTLVSEIADQKSQLEASPIRIKLGTVILSPELQKLLLVSYLASQKYSRNFVNLEDILLACDEIPVLSVLFNKVHLSFENVEKIVAERLGGQVSTQGDNTTPLLNKYSADLTSQAKDSLLHKAIGREKEIQQLIRVLSRESKSNAILIGEAGVGKTAVVEGLATMVAREEIKGIFTDVRVVSLNIVALLGAATSRGVLEDILSGIIDEIKRSGNIILFIDEIHLITGGGNSNESTLIANILKPFLARGELHVIGATTLGEYRKYIEKDPALARRFEPIKVDEPSSENSILICTESAKRLSHFHKVEITALAVSNAVELSKRYITDRFLPDKAIDLLDEACSHATLEGRKVVDENDIKTILAEKTGIPVQKLSQSESDKLTNLEGIINETLIGQGEAVHAVCEVIRRSRAGLKDPKKPIGSFLFLGASGVGKTELAKQICKIVYDTEKAMVRIDMSEFGETHTVQRLIGAPPGYVGYEEGGQLTNPIWERPYSLILLDEIEKAHPKIFDIFLQVLDDGRLTDGQGRTVDFKNAIIIATSNIASEEIIEKLSEAGNIDKADFLQNELMPILKDYFRPEFINRFDDIVIFNPLTKEALGKIVRIQISKIEEKLKDKGIKISLSDEVVNTIVEKTYNPQFGARPTIRLMQDKIENWIAKQIIEGKITNGQVLEITLDSLKI